MDGFVGEIRMFPWNWAPLDWLRCDGTVYSGIEYQVLYAVIGNIYGGNQQQRTFAVPNIQCCAPIGYGTGPGLTPRTLSPNFVGESQVTLTVSSMPNHNHLLNIASSSRGAPGNLVAVPTPTSVPAREIVSIVTFSTNAPDSALAYSAIGPSSQSATAPHSNLQPSLAVQFCICANGYFPVPSQ